MNKLTRGILWLRCVLTGGHKFHFYSTGEDVPWVFGGGIIFHKPGGWACTRCGAEFIVPAPRRAAGEGK